MIQSGKSEKIKDLYNAEIFYFWECQGFGQKKANCVYWLTSVFGGMLVPTLLVTFEKSLTTSKKEFWAILIFGFLMALVSRFLFFPEKERHYHLTQKGIHYTEKDMIPEVAYKIARGLAWVGIVVCIIAVFALGPLAFAGAGAFALMSFGMTNFQSVVDECYVLIDERSVMFDVIDDTVISLSIPGKGGLEYVGDIFTATLEEKKELLSQIHALFPDIETVEIKRLRDKYKHPIYQEMEDSFVE